MVFLCNRCETSGRRVVLTKCENKQRVSGHPTRLVSVTNVCAQRIGRQSRRSSATRLSLEVPVEESEDFLLRVPRLLRIH